MKTNLDDFVAVISNIELGEFDGKLDLLEKAVLERKSKIRANTTIDDFVVGDAVTINDRCGTRYLRGETGVVAGIRRTKLVIHFDDPKGRFARKNADGSIYSSDVIVPIEIVDKKN
jgi:ribosomal protein L21E